MICNNCQNSDFIEYMEEDEAGHAVEWVECRVCGCEDLYEPEEAGDNPWEV